MRSRYSFGLSHSAAILISKSIDIGSGSGKHSRAQSVHRQTQLTTLLASGALTSEGPSAYYSIISGHFAILSGA